MSMCAESRESDFFQLLDLVREKLFNWINVKVYWIDDENGWFNSQVSTRKAKKRECELILEEVVSKAWEKFDDFKPGTNFDAWIFKFADLTLKAYFRKIKTDRTKYQSLEKQLSIENIEKDDPYRNEHSYSRPYTHSMSDDPNNGFMTFDEEAKKVTFNTSLLQEPLSKALQSLAPGERQVFLERTCCDLTLAEVAEYNDMKLDTVKGYYSTARSKIQAKLSFDFFNKTPELMIAGLVAFPSELPVSYVSYMLSGLAERYFQKTDPADKKLCLEVVNALRARIMGEDDHLPTE